MERKFKRSKKTQKELDMISPSSYISGNTVRRLEEADYPETERIVKPRQSEEEKPVQSPAKKNKKSVKPLVSMDSMNMAWFVVFTAATFFCVFRFYQFMVLQNEVSVFSHTLNDKEGELKKIKSRNDANEASLNSYVDLQYVYEIAVGEYGMQHADQSQVILYKKNESEYIKQNEEIPK